MEKQGPDTPGLAHERQAKAVQVVRDVFQGTLHMRKQAAKYLPVFAKETPESYSDRLQQAVLFNAFRRTVKGLVGLVFSNETKIGDDVPPGIVEYLENVDLEGRDIDSFSRDVFEDGFLDGHAGIFVDFQEVAQGSIESLAQERQAGLRPYWIPLRKQDVLKFSTIKVNGRRVLSLLRWKESGEEDDGRWGERSVTRIREYRLVRAQNESGDPYIAVQWSVYEEVKDGPGKKKWLLRSSGTFEGMDEIPLATAYTNRTGYLESEPPLLDLALENIKHWQKRSDKDNVEHVACVPILTLIGVEEEKPGAFSVGPTVGLMLPKGGDAKFAEIQGSGLEASRLSLKDIEHRMAILGLSMLMSETRSAETATSKRIDKSESDAQLILAARNMQQALNEALRLTAKWEGLNSGGTVEVNRDFEKKLLDPQMFAALLDAVDRGRISLETFWDAAKRGEVLSEDFDPELERVRLAEEGMAELDAMRSGGGNGGGNGGQEDDDGEE